MSQTETLDTSLQHMLAVFRGEASLVDGLNVLMSLLVLKHLTHCAAGRTRLEESSMDWNQLVSQTSDQVPHSLIVAFRSVESINSSWKKSFTEMNFLRHSLGMSSGRLLSQAIHLLDRESRACRLISDGLLQVVGRAHREPFTPLSIAKLLAKIVASKPGMSLYDPVCGAGVILSVCSEEVVRQTPNAESRLFIYGQERNTNARLLGIMNLILHDVLDCNVALGNVLHSPEHKSQSGHLTQFDRIVADLPFGLQDWADDHVKYDPYNRFPIIPPRNSGDLAFVLHCLASLKPHGRAAILVPRGALFRGGNEAKIRRFLVEHDVVDAVIELAPNMRFETSIPQMILVLERDKPIERRGRIHFIDASKQFVVAGRYAELSHENIAIIMEAYISASGKLSTSISTCEEIAIHEWNLNVPVYTRQHTEIEFWPDVRPEEIEEEEQYRDRAAKMIDELLSTVNQSKFLD